MWVGVSSETWNGAPSPFAHNARLRTAGKIFELAADSVEKAANLARILVHQLPIPLRIKTRRRYGRRSRSSQSHQTEKNLFLFSFFFLFIAPKVATFARRASRRECD